MKKITSFVILTFLLGGQLFAQKVFDQQYFKQAMDRYLTNPATFLSSEVSPDFRFVGREGTPLDVAKTKAIYDLSLIHI